MARKITNISRNTITAGAAVLLLFFAPLASAASDMIPASKAEIDSWFSSNVGDVASRKATLDPALVEAEAAPKTIKVPSEFKTIGEAVQSVPAGNKNRVIISIAAGNYEEKVQIPKDKPFITFVGVAGKTTLLAASTAAQTGTVLSAVLIVLSDYFMMYNMIVKNSAPKPTGKEGEQALAMRILGEKAAVYNSFFHGFQDTLCDDGLNHFYKDCYVEGTVDFIFGRGKTIFLNHEIKVLDSGGFIFITAHAGESPTGDNGFVLVHCNIAGEAGATNAMLGRAWMPAPRVVIAYTEMDKVVSPLAWSINFKPERAKTVFFKEYKNTGPGADRAQRAPYSQELAEADTAKFLSLSYIDAAKWLLPPPKV